MSNALVALILVALMITTGMTFSKTAIDSVDTITENWKQSLDSDQKAAGTDIDILNAQKNADEIQVNIQNVGKVKLVDFVKWDVLAQYYDQNGIYIIKELSYIVNGSPANNEWTVQNIYTNSTLLQPEVFQPHILDSGEVAEMVINLFPLPGIGTTSWLIICTETGITASVQFQS